MDLVLKVDELRDESLKHDEKGTFRLKTPFKVKWRDEIFRYVNMVWYDDDKEWVVGFFPHKMKNSRDALFKTSDENGVVVIKDAVIVEGEQR